MPQNIPELLVFFARYFPILKVQSCKLYNDKYLAASTQITNTNIFAFRAVIKLWSCEVSFINRKDNRNCSHAGYFLRK